MPKTLTSLTSDMLVMLQLVDDDEKIISTSTFDRKGALEVSDRLRTLAQLIPTTDEVEKPKSKGH